VNGTPKAVPAATGKRAISIEVFYAAIRGSIYRPVMGAGLLNIIEADIPFAMLVIMPGADACPNENKGKPDDVDEHRTSPRLLPKHHLNDHSSDTQCLRLFVRACAKHPERGAFAES